MKVIDLKTHFEESKKSSLAYSHQFKHLDKRFWSSSCTVSFNKVSVTIDNSQYKFVFKDLWEKPVILGREDKASDEYMHSIYSRDKRAMINVEPS